MDGFGFVQAFDLIFPISIKIENPIGWLIRRLFLIIVVLLLFT